MRLFNFRNLTFFAGIFVSRAGWFISIPFIAVYLYKILNCNPLEIGVVLGAGPLATCFSGVFGGVLADKYGNKNIMVFALSMSSIIFMLFGLSDTAITFAFLNIALGIFRAFFDAASKSHLIFFLTAVAYILTVIGYFFLLLKTQIHGVKTGYLKNVWDSLVDIFNNKQVLVLITIGVIVYFALSQLDSTLPQVLIEARHPISTYAMLLVCNASIVILSQFIFNRLLNSIGLKSFIIFAIAAYIIGFIALAFSSTMPLLFISIILFSVGEVANINISNLLTDRLSPARMKGAYFGITSISMLGLSIGPFLGGAILKYSNAHLLYLLTSALILSTLYLYYKVIE